MVIGIDFGSEWMKVGIVGPKTFEVVLNEQSTRKTPATVAFDKGDFLVGVDAQNLLTKSPKSVFSNTQLLLGRYWGDPYLKEVEHFFLYDVEKSEERQVYRIPYGSMNFVPEEVAALVLTYAKDIAAKTGHSIKDCVITVPSFWTQYQRQAVIDAANLAGLHVLSLINENSAVGLNYGTSREFTEEGVNVLFYDMGATSTKASLIHFKSLRDSKTNKTTPQLQVIYSAWDASLGGKQFDYRLAQYFVEVIKQNNQLDLSSSANPRAFARILKEAQRTKEILSANSEARVMIEGLTSDFDFRTDITRQKFEELSLDLIQRATQPIETILRFAGINSTELEGIEMVGGGLRIPRVQEELAKFTGRSDLDKHLNGDESCVMGATFYAATLSASFRVKEFKLKDITPFTVSVIVKSETGNLNTSAELFKPGNRLGSKKSLSFSSNENFTLELTYQTSPQMPIGIRRNFGSFFISGVPTLEQFNYTGKPKIHATCRLNSNGMVVIENIEAEVVVLSYPQERETDGKPIDELSAEKSSETTGDDAAEETEAKESDLTEKSDELKFGESEAQVGEDSKLEQENKTKVITTEKVKKRIHRIPLKVTPLWISGMSTEEQKESLKKLLDIRLKTDSKREKEKNKNNLESYIYQTREKLFDDIGVSSVTTEEQRERFATQLSNTEEWLYSEGCDDFTATDFLVKLRELKVQGDAINLRMQELALRPQAVESIRTSINASINLIPNITETLDTKEGEVEEVLKSCAHLLQWLEAREQEQGNLQPYEDPAFTSQEVYAKWKLLESKIKNLLRRPKKKILIPETIENSTESSNPSGDNPIEEEAVNNDETTQQEDSQESQHDREEDKNFGDEHNHDEL